MVIEAAGEVEDEELGSAHGVEGAGGGLGLVEEDGEWDMLFGDHFCQVGRGVVRVGGGVVRADAEESDVAWKVVAGEAHDFGHDVHDVRAMAAEEDDDESFGAGAGGGGDGLACDHIGQGEIGNVHAGGEGCAGGESHEEDFLRRDAEKQSCGQRCRSW